MRIAHIADVHWRGLTRHTEYRRSFKDMFEQLASLKVDAICLAGETGCNLTYIEGIEFAKCASL